MKLVLIAVMAVFALIICLLAFSVGKNRDWPREDELQEAALKKLNEKRKKE